MDERLLSETLLKYNFWNISNISTRRGQVAQEGASAQHSLSSFRHLPMTANDFWLTLTSTLHQHSQCLFESDKLLWWIPTCPLTCLPRSHKDGWDQTGRMDVRSHQGKKTTSCLHSDIVIRTNILLSYSSSRLSEAHSCPPFLQLCQAVRTVTCLDAVSFPHLQRVIGGPSKKSF